WERSKHTHKGGLQKRRRRSSRTSPLRASIRVSGTCEIRIAISSRLLPNNQPGSADTSDSRSFGPQQIVLPLNHSEDAAPSKSRRPVCSALEGNAHGPTESPDSGGAPCGTV